MKKESYKNAKNIKYFKPLDIVFYSIIIVIIAVLLCVFLLPKNESSLDKIEIYKDNVLVYSYDYQKEEGQIIKVPSETSIKEYDKDDCHYVEISFDGHFNIIEIGDDYAKMQDANCSHYKPCVNNFTPIKKGGDVIICMPHNIKIVGIGNNVDYNEVRL